MKDKFTNIFSEDYLSTAAYDFIQSSKGIGYDIEENLHISDILNSKYILDHITHGTVEISLSDDTSLKISGSFENSSSERLNKLFENRISTRNFTPQKLSFDLLSEVLLGGSRIYSSLPGTLNFMKKRSTASAGGLYPIDIYLIALNITGCEEGVYFYNQHTLHLQKISNDKNIRKEYESIFMVDNKSDIDYSNAAGVIVLAGMLNRVAFKYGDRGVRYALIDAGAITQNLYLICAALKKVGCCACSGFMEEQLLELVGLGNADEIIPNVVLIGNT